MVTESGDMTIEDVSCIGSNPGCLNLAVSGVNSKLLKCAYHCEIAVMSSALIKFNCQRKRDRLSMILPYWTVAYYVKVRTWSNVMYSSVSIIGHSVLSATRSSQPPNK